MEFTIFNFFRSDMMGLPFYINYPKVGVSRYIDTNGDEACKRAQVMAMDYGTPSECACKIRGASNICQVQSSGPKPAFSVINALRKEIRERFGCKPEDKDCKRKPAVSIGGIR